MTKDDVNSPTDAELWQLHMQMPGVHKNPIDFARAVLAKWGTPPAVAGEPAQWQKRHQLRTNGEWENTHEHDAKWWRDNSQGWEIRALYTTSQPTQAQAGAVPLDEARRLFDAGWKAAARFCDREDVVADGIIGFGACPRFEAAFAAAHGIKGGQHG